MTSKSPEDTPGVVAMDKFHRYLTENYVGGSERFFSPTGFLDDFQRSVEVQVKDTREHVWVKDVDQAVKLIEPVLAGSAGVYDLTSEPGTGKTSVLPFRFSSKRVVVALPTPFDAWSAYQMATGVAKLKLKGLTLGTADAGVVYTDSYMAAKAVLSGYLDYDIMIVDECDSQKGVTKFLAEVRAPGKLLIRMSASHGRVDKGPSRSFRVTEDETMPDVRKSMSDLVKFVKDNHKDRSLVLLPDAETAIEMGKLMPDAKVVCTKSSLGDIARSIVNQEGPRLYIADDTCARGLNLNLSALFDTQLVAEFGNLRSLTGAESLQRKGRVGRNKAGYYFSPGLELVQARENDIDLVRHNVVRSFAGVRQMGSQKLRVTRDEAKLLKCADAEPFNEVVAYRAAEKAMVSSPSSSSPAEKYETAVDSSSGSSVIGSTSSKVLAAPWLCYFSSGKLDKPKDGKVTYVAKHRPGKNAFVRSKRRTGSTDDSDSDRAVRRLSEESLAEGLGAMQLRTHADNRKVLPVAEMAPYAKSSVGRGVYKDKLALPMSPPVMDLTALTYDMDWPALIRDRLCTGGDLPTLVPPGSWRHTSVGGIGNNWLARLETIAVGDAVFDDSEFEIVCRAWNLLVGQSWVKKAPGLNNLSNVDKLEYCARYFQSYFLLQDADA